MLILLPGGDKRDGSWIGHERKEEDVWECKEVTRRPLYSPWTPVYLGRRSYDSSFTRALLFYSPFLLAL